MAPVTAAPSRKASPGLVSPTLTRNVLVTGSAWGETSRTRPLAVAAGSPLSVTVIGASGHGAAQHAFGNFENGVASVPPRQLHDHAARLDDLARFGADGRDDAGRIGLAAW